MTNLKRIIDEKGVRQRWLAEQVGVTEVSMSRYVSGKRIPKAQLAIRMADVLGVDVKDLYEWDDAHVIGENEAQPEMHEERTETHGVCLDVIDRQATLDWLKNEWNGMIASLLDGIKALPSAQPEPCEDTISRQAVIEINRSYHGQMPNEVNHRIWKEINELPSAQPEIIHCRECKHWKQQTNYAGAPLSFGFCESDDMWRSLYGETYEVSHIDTDDDFYCGFAERRTDEV